ncbi:hypothetical protein E4U46_000924, partial [Claviceps purpurea]
FENWPLKLFTEANTGVRSCLLDLLQKRGIETKKGSGDSVPKILHDIAKFGKADPIVPASPIRVPTSPVRPTTPTHPVAEAETTQTMQLMILQTMQQIQQQSRQQSQEQTRMMQQSMQQSQQQTQMMQQMMEQMTRLTVKQRAPTPTRSTQNSDKNPTGTYKLTYVNTESDKSDTSMPDAASPLKQTTHHSITEKDPDITMPDASPLIRRVTHRSVAEEDPDTNMRDAPPLTKSTFRSVVHGFTPASKDYLNGSGLPPAPGYFPQQNKPKSFLKKEIYQPHPLQVHHAQVPITNVQPKPDAVRPQREKPQHAEESEIAQAVETIGTMIHQEMEAIEKKVESLSSEVAQQRIKLMSYDPSIPTAKQPETRHQQRCKRTRPLKDDNTFRNSNTTAEVKSRLLQRIVSARFFYSPLPFRFRPISIVNKPGLLPECTFSVHELLRSLTPVVNMSSLA